MIGAIVYQLTRCLSEEQIKCSGFDTYFVDHTTGIYPIAASGVPYSASMMQSKGDTLTDLHEDMAADAAILQEQPAEQPAEKTQKNRQKKRRLIFYRSYPPVTSQGKPIANKQSFDRTSCF